MSVLRGFGRSHQRGHGNETYACCRKEFEIITEGLSDALGFTRTIGVGMENAPYEKGGSRGVLGEVDFYTRSVVHRYMMNTDSHLYRFRSHEGLMLNYEEAMTREFIIPSSHSSSDPRVPPPPRAYYNTSAHFLWIGDRTRQLDGAHVEYFRGIRNPIGIKVGPSMQDEELVRLLNSTLLCHEKTWKTDNLSKSHDAVVNPDKDSGRVTLITRYGAGKVEKFLPGHITAVQKSGHPVIWICDPMHGKYVGL